jgi:hypothetical protein
LTSRSWRFFLSAALVAVLFVPISLARWRQVSDHVVVWTLYGSVLGFAGVSTWLSLLFPAIAVGVPGTGVKNAVGDLHGNVWRIFWVGTLAVLSLLLATIVVAILQWALFGGSINLTVRIAFTPLEGAMSAAVYVLFVVIASRFYLVLGSRPTGGDRPKA